MAIEQVELMHKSTLEIRIKKQRKKTNRIV